MISCCADVDLRVTQVRSKALTLPPLPQLVHRSQSVVSISSEEMGESLILYPACQKGLQCGFDVFVYSRSQTYR